MKNLQMPSVCSLHDEPGGPELMDAAALAIQDKASNELLTDHGVYDNGSSSSFEFPKGDKKPTGTASTHLRFGPSKWDDAQKWLANSHHSTRNKIIPANGHTLANPVKQSASNSGRDGFLALNGAFHMSKDDSTSSHVHGQEAASSRQSLTVDASNGSAAGEANSFAFPAPPSKFSSNNSFDFYPPQEEPSDTKELRISHESVYDAPLLKSADPPAWDPASFVMPEPALRSVSMRDMGTEMTPIASQEPSRTGTPIQATTPLMRSPVSSGASTPRGATPASSPLLASEDAIQPSENVSTADNDSRASEQCETDMHVRTRKEIQNLGVHLGKINISAWTSKEEEDGDSSKLLKNIDLEEVKKNVLETRAAAWEEAEEAKYMARFKREEGKIQAWENHEKAKAEAEMRRIEVKIEKIRSHAHEKLMNKLAAAKRQAEERRAVAEARRGEQAAKTVAHADYIRRTGRVPSPFLGCMKPTSC